MTKLCTKGIPVFAISVLLLAGVAPAQETQTPEQLAWNVLQSGVASKNSQERVTAVTALALITDNNKAVTMAEQALQDSQYPVRAAAATSLGTMKATGAIPALKDALKDTSPSVIMAAAKSLVEMNNELGYDAYYAVATGEQKSGTSLVASEQSALNQLLHNPKDLAETAFQQGVV